MALCILHDPLFSGPEGEDLAWRRSGELSDAGPEVAVSAYDHHDERRAPQTPACDVDLDHGMTQVVVVAGCLVDHPPARAS